MWSRLTNSFSQGRCVCFSDSSLPQLTDLEKLTGKNVQTRMMRERRGGGVKCKGEDDYLITCVFSGVLGLCNAPCS